MLSDMGYFYKTDGFSVDSMCKVSSLPFSLLAETGMNLDCSLFCNFLSIFVATPMKDRFRNK